MYNYIMMMRKGTEMIIVKTKSQLRAETEKQVKAFLRKGGSVEVVKARKAPTQKMNCKTSRGFVVGTSGFANGMPKKSTFSLV
jgi:hypothetical protein